uniref:Interleukin 6 receptor n=1 Tax=Otus sunia TaxID=257818 RepID=A0A8C8EBC3_9STRI
MTGCPPPALGTPVGSPNVTLTCRDEGLANVTVSWQLEERGAGGGPRRRLAEGNALLLRHLRYEDSGRYGCYVGSRLLRALKLLVEGGSAPGQGCPSRRHPVRRWGCRPTPGAHPRRFTAENATEQRCRYFSKARKFVCRVKVPPGADTESLVVSTCVSNGAGGSAAAQGRPDPPVNVTVQALEKAPQRLRVNWSYPSSWDPRFYWLRFQVRYRPEPARTFTEVRVDQVMTPWLDIRDALRGTRHVVQVRAQEEFGHGTWSEWSREVVGTPWTGRKGGGEMWFQDWGLSPRSPDSHWAVVKASARSVASPYAFLVAGGSLLLGIALFIAIMVRQTWQTGGQRGAKPEGEGQHVLVPLGAPSPPLSDTPLLSPPSPPDPGGLHVTNLDYFFSGQ